MKKQIISQILIVVLSSSFVLSIGVVMPIIFGCDWYGFLVCGLVGLVLLVFPIWDIHVLLEMVKGNYSEQ